MDLPTRAEMVLGLLEDPANMLPAFEALTVLEGTAKNAKMAWKRHVYVFNVSACCVLCEFNGLNLQYKCCCLCIC